MRLKTPAAVAAGLAIVGLLAAGTAGADPTEPAPEPTPAPAPPATPKTTIDADGTYAVGTEIVPGVYASAGPIVDGTCYWRRTAPTAEGQERGETLDRAMTKKSQVVQIQATDGSFRTSGCQTWQLTDAPAPSAGLPPVIAGLQMRAYLDTLNRNAKQFEANPPRPAP
jgi:hypothetical protein